MRWTHLDVHPLQLRGWVKSRITDLSDVRVNSRGAACPRPPVFTPRTKYDNMPHFRDFTRTRSPMSRAQQDHYTTPSRVVARADTHEGPAAAGIIAPPCALKRQSALKRFRATPSLPAPAVGGTLPPGALYGGRQPVRGTLPTVTAEQKNHLT